MEGFGEGEKQEGQLVTTTSWNRSLPPATENSQFQSVCFWVSQSHQRQPAFPVKQNHRIICIKHTDSSEWFLFSQHPFIVLVCLVGQRFQSLATLRFLLVVLDALRDGVTGEGSVYGSKRGYVEGSGVLDLKAVVENQAEWWANCWFECSMRWHVCLVSFDQFHIHFGQSRRNKVGWSHQNFYNCHLCDEAALWKSISVSP